jgi:RNA polymerase sigma-54 factor
MLSLTQRLSQQQKLSPQQIQYQKLLQLNTLALEQRIKTELEINPILEEETELRQDDKEPEELEEGIGEPETDENEFNKEDSEFGLEDYMNDEEYFDESVKMNKNFNDVEKNQPVAPSKESLSEHLLDQLYMLQLDDKLILLGEEIIGDLDEDGYLIQDLNKIVEEINLFQHTDINMEEAEALLKKIQTFDPVGIASRTLQECLIIQIQNSSFDPYYSYLAEEMLKNHYESFVQKRYDDLMLKMNVTEDTLKNILNLIQRLNPKPGEGNIAAAESNQITPDFIVEKNNNDFIITLNDRAMPSVVINRTYLEMLSKNKGKKKLSEHEKNTYKFLREKYDSAKWFIACIQQRRDTLINVMRAIVEKQYEFFDKGTKFIKPMIYKDIADEIKMDISTISRVVNGKYVQSQQGIHELKYFFSEGLSTDSGEDVSNKQIKERIKEIIDGENKKSPLSDDKIAEMLNVEGIHIARRTIAKYREALRISVARLRKEL